MAHEGPREKGHAGFWTGVVAIFPHPTVQCVHKPGFACQDSDRQSAAENLAVGGHVGSNPEERLGATQMHSKARYDLVKDECSSGLLGNSPELL